MTSPIAAAALAALEARRAADAALAEQMRGLLLDAVRATLAGWGLDVDALTVETVDLDALMVVVRDEAVSLAVYDDGRVVLVECVDEQWTERSGALSSLAELGEALSPEVLS